MSENFGYTPLGWLLIAFVSLRLLAIILRVLRPSSTVPESKVPFPMGALSFVCGSLFGAAITAPIGIIFMPMFAPWLNPLGQELALAGIVGITAGSTAFIALQFVEDLWVLMRFLSIPQLVRKNQT